MRDEDERPPAARPAGEMDCCVRRDEHTYTAAAAGPGEEGAPQQACDCRARYASDGTRQERAPWPTLEARCEATESEPDNFDFSANLSAESGPGGGVDTCAVAGVIVPSVGDGLSAVLGDLADLNADALIAEYDAQVACRTFGGRDA